jgi:6-phosphogluconolactonase
VFRVDSASFADEAAKLILERIADSIRERGRCTLALAGGTTPGPVYQRMSVSPVSTLVEWERVGVYFGDERCVPADHPDSNYRMAHQALLRHVAIPTASVHRIAGEGADPELVARDYERVLPGRLDVLLLGMGADGHTASLFPHSPALAERTRRIVSVSRPPPSPPRITITPPVIAAAHTVLVLASGAGKAAAVARALEGTYAPEELPVQIALRGTWIIDDAAGRELRRVAP